MVTPEMTWQNYPALSQEGPLHLAAPGQLPPPPSGLERSVNEADWDVSSPGSQQAESIAPPALMRTRSSMPRTHLEPRQVISSEQRLQPSGLSTKVSTLTQTKKHKNKK